MNISLKSLRTKKDYYEKKDVGKKTPTPHTHNIFMNKNHR